MIFFSVENISISSSKSRTADDTEFTQYVKYMWVYGQFMNLKIWLFDMSPHINFVILTYTESFGLIFIHYELHQYSFDNIEIQMGWIRLIKVPDYIPAADLAG